MSDGAMTFQPMDGEAVTVKPIPTPRQDGTTDIYEAKVGADSFALSVASKICTDTMSGMPFPKSVTVALGANFSGCGGEPSTLLQGQWNITEIDGKPVIAGSSPTIGFEADGKINGNASCNRFFGGYTLTGEGLTAGDLGPSMMMCEQTLMDQEMKVLDILKGLGGFGIGEDGKLILRTNGRSETAIEPDAARRLIGTAADSAECHTDQRVVGGRLGRPLVGVVPVDLVTDGPGLSANLVDVDDADGERLDRFARGCIMGGNAKDGADQQTTARGDGGGGRERDRVAGLDIVLHGRCPFSD